MSAFSNDSLTKGTLRAIATRPAKRGAMVSHAATVMDAGAGLAFDAHRKPGRAQVTIVSWEKWQAACAEMKVDLPWTMRRANLLIAGVALAPDIGRRISIGDVVLEITGETDPCSRMDDQHMGLRAALTPDSRGGVRCRIITGGSVALGVAVLWRERK